MPNCRSYTPSQKPITALMIYAHWYFADAAQKKLEEVEKKINDAGYDFRPPKRDEMFAYDCNGVPTKAAHNFYENEPRFILRKKFVPRRVIWEESETTTGYCYSPTNRAVYILSANLTDKDKERGQFYVKFKEITNG